MCGLVGFASTIDGFEKNRKSYITQALFLDTLRGWDGSGLYLVDKNFKTSLLKDSIPGSSLITTKKYCDYLEKNKNISLAIGHNRHATTGGKQKIHSHPFSYKNIILAHNGTLTKGTFDSFPGHGQNNLKDIDSYRITASMAERGVIETLENLSGAYALTWYDTKQKTFNIARNNQRPLAIGYSTTKSEMLWASEKWMLERLATRCHIPLKYIEELPIGIHFMFDLENKNFIENVKETKFNIKSQFNYPTNIKYNNHHRKYYSNNSTHKNEFLANLGLKRDCLLIGKLTHFAPSKIEDGMGIAHFKLDRKDDPTIRLSKNGKVDLVCYNIDISKIYGKSFKLNQEKNKYEHKIGIGEKFLLLVEYGFTSFVVKEAEGITCIVCKVERLAREEELKIWYKPYSTDKKTNTLIWDTPYLVYKNQDEKKSDESIWTPEQEDKDDTEELSYIMNEDLVTREEFIKHTKKGCHWCTDPIDPDLEDGSNLTFTENKNPICSSCIETWNKYCGDTGCGC